MKTNSQVNAFLGIIELLSDNLPHIRTASYSRAAHLSYRQPSKLINQRARKIELLLQLPVMYSRPTHSLLRNSTANSERSRGPKFTKRNMTDIPSSDVLI